VAESFHGRPGPIIGERLLAQSHTHDLTGDIGDEQEHSGIVNVIARPRLLLGPWWQTFPPGAVGRKPHGDRGFDIRRLTAPYERLVHPSSLSSCSASDP
jgi:hypothetical protein